MIRRVTLWVVALLIFCALSQATTTYAAQYVINGITLNEKVPLKSQEYHAYDCGPHQFC
jgi:hypothetical protein